MKSNLGPLRKFRMSGICSSSLLQLGVSHPGGLLICIQPESVGSKLAGFSQVAARGKLWPATYGRLLSKPGSCAVQYFFSAVSR